MGWVVFGAWFPSEPLPFQVQEVSLITAEQFAQLSQQRMAPVVAPEPLAPAAPTQPETAPEVAAVQPPPTEITQPAPITPPPPDAEVPERPEPEPQPQPVPPAPETPNVPEIVRDTPPPIQPDASLPTDRVAPVPIAQPEVDTTPADEAQPEVAPDEGAEAPREVQEATAPEAASDHIVTEAEPDATKISAAPTESLRPRTRPARPVETPPAPVETARETAVETPAEAPSTPRETAATPSEPAVSNSAVEDALAAALAGGADVEAPVASGPPLTSGEKEALRVEVSQCWNVGSLSSEALRTTVEVTVSLSQDGVPDAGSIRLKSSTGGSGNAVDQAFEAARRAIIRCGARGFKLPPEKYGQWRDIEMTFNPERMRNR